MKLNNRDLVLRGFLRILRFNLVQLADIGKSSGTLAVVRSYRENNGKPRNLVAAIKPVTR